MWNSLRLRLTMIFIGLAVGPLVLVGTILAQRSFTLEREQALDLQRQVAQRVSTEIEASLRERESELRLIGGEIRGLDRSDRAQELGLLLGMMRSGVNRNFYEGLILLDDQGREQVYLSRRKVIPTDELGDRSGAMEFEEPKSGGETYFGPVWFDETTGEALMTIAIPLFELRSFRLRSVLVADVRFKTVGDLIADLQVSESQTVYVVNPEGWVVAHQDPSVELQDVRFEPPEQRDAQAGLDGADVVLAVDEFQLGEQGFSVVAERPEAEALEPAIHMVFTIVATIVVTLVVASGLGFLVVRQIVRPIESLTTTARAISAGDLSQQVEVTSRDEIGQLAETFNSMTAQLRDLFSSLEQRIAERKQAEEELRESQQFIENVANTAPLLLYVVDLSESRVIYANSQFITQLGYTPEQMRIEVVSERFVHPGDHAVIEETLACIARAKDGEIIEAEFQSKHASDEWRWLHNRSIVLSRNPDGSVKQYLGTVLDITERKLMEEALRLKDNAIASSVDAIAIAEFAGNLTYVNASFLRMWGYDDESEVLGKPAVGFWQMEENAEAVVEALRDRQSWTGELMAKRKDGSLFDVQVSASIVTDETGKPICMMSSFVDVTERKRMEEALRESEEKYRQLFELESDAIFLIDNETDRILEVNAAGLALYGYSREELLQKRNTDVSAEPDKTRKATVERWSQVPVRFHRKKNGTVFPVEITGRHFTWRGREVHIAAIRNITERMQVEEEREQLLVQIRAQAQRVQQIVDTVPEGVLLLDTDGRAVLANPAAEGDIAVLADAEVGDTLTHLGDRPLAELLTSPPSGRWHEVKANERTFEIIARPMEPATGPTADGQLLNGDGPEPGDWVLVINDVTQEREIQRRVQQQERLAAVGQLAAGIAHDFNNIMATIVLYAQMTAWAEGLPATVRERMTTINQQAQHATRLIQQILDFGRRAVLERQPLDLLPLLKEQSKLLKRTLPESIEIELAYRPDEYTINADPTRMQQMVTNLAVNARDAMPEGGSLRIGLERIRIEGREAAPLPEMKAGEWVQVTVSDTGTGIPPDVLPHIYEPFFTTRAPLGSGLGLSQVHGIVAQHEGHIDVETQLGQGTTFIIYLPALPIRQPEPSTQGTARLVQGEGQTILVVEDSAAIRRALVESLQVLNYQAMEASNGQEALAVLEQHDEEIALVLSDVVMPEMGGIALLRSMRQNGLAMPVVMLTGHPLKKELENLRAQGMVAWLVKPPSLEQLAEVMAQALS
jgi:two-component system cell cycle sensor histidine kinase/response regulator CckA